MTLYIKGKLKQPSEDTLMTDKTTASDKEKLAAFRRAEDWERLAILEVRVNDHEEDIRQLIEHQHALTQSLDKINKTLSEVRVAVFTAVGIFVIQQVGLWQAILGFLGLVK